MQPTIRIEHELLAVEQQHRVAAMLELKAPPAPIVERPPLNLALVVDESGSMSGDKIATARRCARYLVERLRPTDRLALMGFDSSVYLHAGLAPVDRDRLLPSVDGMRAGSMTNLSGGWLKGVEELQRLETTDPRKVLLLSDGHANQGITDRDELASMVAGAARKGIGTTTIGFGDGFDEDLMTGMADAGRGNAYYAATVEDAPGIFAAEFDNLASTVAQNVSVEIRPTDDVKLLGTLNEYPTTEVTGGIQVQLGDTFGDEIRRLVFELHIPHLAALGPRRVADVVLRYVTVGDHAQMHEVVIPMTVNVVDAATAATSPPDQDVTEQVTILRAAESRKRAQRLADEGRFDEAGAELDGALGLAREMAAVSPAPQHLLDDADRLERNLEVLRERTWSPVDRKRMHYEAHMSSKSRFVEEKRREKRGDR
jgi:Ca-activated chloride channel family protein